MQYGASDLHLLVTSVLLLAYLSGRLHRLG